VLKPDGSSTEQWPATNCAKDHTTMAGKIRRMIDRVIADRSGGNPTLASTTKAKLIFKGFNPDRFTLQSDDDPVMIERLTKAAAELGVKL
jgi:hypothetical protein